LVQPRTGFHVASVHSMEDFADIIDSDTWRKSDA
jgi:hypothetical protein